MRRWAVDPDRHSPGTRPEDCYSLVYEDDRSEEIEVSLTYAEASEIAAAHNAEVGESNQDAGLLHEQLNAWQDQREALLRYAQGLVDGMARRPQIVASDAAQAIRKLMGEEDDD